jgi:hypothetical protein
MPEIILPSTMVGLLAAFEPCFHAPTYRVFQLVLAGWMHCLGRRTVTAVALASGGVGGITSRSSIGSSHGASGALMSWARSSSG